MVVDKKQIDAEAYARIRQLLQSGLYSQAEQASTLALNSGFEPNYLPWFYLGVARQFQGKIVTALKAFQMAHQIAPDEIQVINAKASCFSQLERHQEAYNSLLLAYEKDPENGAVCANIGVALEKLGNKVTALSYYDKALSCDPKSRVALTNRGTLLTLMGRVTEGLEHNRQAHALCPEVFDLLYNLVDALIGVYQYDEALAYCDAGLAWMPRHAHMMFKKGMILSCMCQFEEAQKYLALAQAIEPEILNDLLPNFREAKLYADARVLNLDAMYQQQLYCFWRDREQYLKNINAAIQLREVSYSLVHSAIFGFQSFSLAINVKTRLMLAENIGSHVRDFAGLTGLPPFKFNELPRERLRIGYVSPDFRRHPSGYLSRQIYGLHDREKFEVYAYSLSDVKADDQIYQHIRETSDMFREVASLNTTELANLIHQDEVDILIDMAGYTTLARPEVMALRPAPIQVSYIGYVESIGGEFIDYTVTDGHVFPTDIKSFWHEQTIRLPHHTFPYDHEIDNTPAGICRSDYDLPDQVFVFCCFNNSYKIEPEIFDAWMNILKAVPNSVLWLLDRHEQTRLNLQNEAQLRGVDIERLVFAPFIDVASHCLRYQLADLFLDTLWHGAHTTALEALWQGLPLLTREGEVVSARLGASCLHVLGMEELIAQTTAEYEEKAIYYAQNPTALKALREKLKSARYSSPLFNTALHVKHLECAYEMAWQRYEAGLPPAQIDVPELDYPELTIPMRDEKAMH